MGTTPADQLDTYAQGIGAPVAIETVPVRILGDVTVRERPPVDLVTFEQPVTQKSKLLLGANASRERATLYNTGDTAVRFASQEPGAESIGGSFPIPPGQSFVLNTRGPVYISCPGGASSVAVAAEFFAPATRFQQ